jgi:hypothetical protein
MHDLHQQLIVHPGLIRWHQKTPWLKQHRRLISIAWAMGWITQAEPTPV